MADTVMLDATFSSQNPGLQLAPAQNPKLVRGTIDQELWRLARRRIEEVYVRDNKSLEVTTEMLKREYHFHPTPTQFKKVVIGGWGLRKYKVRKDRRRPEVVEVGSIMDHAGVKKQCSDEQDEINPPVIDPHMEIEISGGSPTCQILSVSQERGSKHLSFELESSPFNVDSSSLGHDHDVDYGNEWEHSHICDSPKLTRLFSRLAVDGVELPEGAIPSIDLDDMDDKYPVSVPYMWTEDVADSSAPGVTTLVEHHDSIRIKRKQNCRAGPTTAKSSNRLRSIHNQNSIEIAQQLRDFITNSFAEVYVFGFGVDNKRDFRFPSQITQYFRSTSAHFKESLIASAQQLKSLGVFPKSHGRSIEEVYLWCCVSQERLPLSEVISLALTELRTLSETPMLHLLLVHCTTTMDDSLAKGISDLGVILDHCRLNIESRTPKADVLHQRVHNIICERLSANHYVTLLSTNLLAFASMIAKAPTLEMKLREALQVSLTSLGPRHWTSLGLMLLLSVCLQNDHLICIAMRLRSESYGTLIKQGELDLVIWLIVRKRSQKLPEIIFTSSQAINIYVKLHTGSRETLADILELVCSIVETSRSLENIELLCRIVTTMKKVLGLYHRDIV